MHQTPVAVFLLQLIIIIFTVRLFGILFKKLNQPTVIGEIIAGIVLGPSFFGLFFPDAWHFVFPIESLGTLQQLSQLGLILFMFVVGMDFNHEALRGLAKETISISLSGIIIPFILGCGFALCICNDPDLTTDTSTLSFVLFTGIAMSVTAFPVLVRILKERNMTNTPLGVLATSIAAVIDVIAWIVLALVVAIANHSSLMQPVYLLLALAGILIASRYIVKPFWIKYFNKHDPLRKASFSLVIILLFLFAYATELSGIHALFGSFIAGIVIPDRDNIREKLTGKIEIITTMLLLPLFFVITGLRTQINLLTSPASLLLLLVILLIAFAGKIGGCLLPARMLGKSWKESLSIGVLMNTRGLMELVVLNLGYEMGILSQTLFTALTLMAIISTMVTSPLLSFIEKRFK